MDHEQFQEVNNNMCVMLYFEKYFSIKIDEVTDCSGIVQKIMKTCFSTHLLKKGKSKITQHF